MKRIFSILILGHWFLFFSLHAFGALAGSMTFTSLAALPFSVDGLEAGGPMQVMPLISAGMGLASLLASTLFSLGSARRNVCRTISGLMQMWRSLPLAAPQLCSRCFVLLFRSSTAIRQCCLPQLFILPPLFCRGRQPVLK